VSLNVLCNDDFSKCEIGVVFMIVTPEILSVCRGTPLLRRAYQQHTAHSFLPSRSHDNKHSIDSRFPRLATIPVFLLRFLLCLEISDCLYPRIAP
jgi:hypothetical protein